MDLAQILQQPEGFTPPDVTVTIDKVYPYKDGEGTNGPWSFQDIAVRGGGKLKLKNLMREFPESRVGMTVTIKANQSKQHGLTGLKVAHEEYQNKTYDKLIITPSARWEWAEPGKEQSNGHAPAQAPQAATNGHSSDTTYDDHVLACAELAGVVTAKLGITDPAAMQACFATICIDTKDRRFLLTPKTLAVPAEAEREPEEPPEDLQDDPFNESDDIPF